MSDETKAQSYWTPERNEDLRRHVTTELSASQIAARLGSGISRNAVIGKVARMGLRLFGAKNDGRPPIPDAKRQRIIEMLKAGNKHSQIIDACGVSRKTINKIAKKNGLGREGGRPRGAALATQYKPDGYRSRAFWSDRGPPCNESSPQVWDISGIFPGAPGMASRVTILMLTGKTCRWPLGEVGTPEFAFCGAPPYPGKPYCQFHCAFAYMEVPSRRTFRS